MAKWRGRIGYAVDFETAPGVWRQKIVERMATGDLERVARRYESTENLNDDLVMSHQISVILDAYMSQHFATIKYVWWGGARWRVNYVEVRHPRLTLTIGKVYNGPTAETP